MDTNQCPTFAPVKLQQIHAYCDTSTYMHMVIHLLTLTNVTFCLFYHLVSYNRFMHTST